MASPFFDAISAGVSAAPGTGTFTIGTVTSGFRAFSNVPANIIVQYRADEGTTWEIGMGLWNGTTLTRSIQYSSSGSLVSFTAAVVLSLTIPADKIAQHPAIGSYTLYSPQGASTYSTGSTTINSSTNGSWAAGFPNVGTANTTRYADGVRVVGTSATTANALVQQLFGSVTAKTNGSTFTNRGYELFARVGLGVVPTGMRAVWGWVQYGSSGWSGTAEPATQGFMGATSSFTKSSTQTNFQWTTGQGTSLTTVDTGVSATAGSMYEVAIWANPSSARSVVYGYLARLGTSEIWFGSDANAANTSGTDRDQTVQIGCSLSSTTGTAVEMCTQNVYVRSAF